MAPTSQRRVRTRNVMNNQEQHNQQYLEPESPMSWSHYRQQRQQRKSFCSNKDSQQINREDTKSASDELRIALHSLYGESSVCGTTRNSGSSNADSRQYSGGHGHGHEQGYGYTAEKEGNDQLDKNGGILGNNTHAYRIREIQRGEINGHDQVTTIDDDSPLFGGNDSSIAFSLSDIEDDTDETSNRSDCDRSEDINRCPTDGHQPQHAEWTPHHFQQQSHIHQETSENVKDGDRHTFQKDGIQTLNSHRSKGSNLPLHNISHGSSGIAVIANTTSNNSTTSSINRSQQLESASVINDNIYEVPPDTCTENEIGVASITPASYFQHSKGGASSACTVEPIGKKNGISITPPAVYRHHQNGEEYAIFPRKSYDNATSKVIAEGEHHHSFHQQQRQFQTPHHQVTHQHRDERNTPTCAINAQQQYQQTYPIHQTHTQDNSKTKSPPVDCQAETLSSVSKNGINNNLRKNDETKPVQCNAEAIMVDAETCTVSPLYKHTNNQQEQQEINSLRDQLKLVRRERDILREDINEVLQTRGLNRNIGKRTNNTSSSHTHSEMLERKYQVELDSMRQVANQVKAEADEKTAIIEKKLEQIKKKMEMDAEKYHCQIRKKDEILREKEWQLQQREKADREERKDGRVWKDSFKSLVEQLCFHAESGALKWDAKFSAMAAQKSVGMDEVILAALASEEARGEVEKEMSDLLYSLSRCRQVRVVNSFTQMDEVSPPLSDSRCREGPEEKDVVKSISVAVDTADLPIFAQQYHSDNNNKIDTDDPNLDRHYYNNSLPHQHLTYSGVEEEKRITELQLENASLRGTNEHLTDQFQQCRNQLQSLKESAVVLEEGTPFTSPYNTTVTPSIVRADNTPSKPTKQEEVSHLSNLVNQLKRSNLQITQSNVILTGNIQILEEENSKVVQRSIDLEHLAEEATAECERLMRDIDNLKQNEGRLTAKKEEVVSELEMLKNEQKDEIKRFQIEKEKMEEELLGRIEIIDQDRAKIHEAKKEVDFELASLFEKNSHLVSTVNEAEKQIQLLSTQLDELNDRSKTWEKGQHQLDEYTKLESKIKEVEEESSSLLKSKLDLEDECARLRNLNSLTKAKMEEQVSELRKLRETQEASKRGESALTLRLESTRAENVMLADGNTEVQLECSRLTKECDDLRKSLDSYTEEAERMRHEASMLRKECSIAVEQKDHAERMCNEAQDQNSTLTSKVEAAEIELDKVNNRIKALVDEREEMKQLTTTLQEELEELNNNKKAKEDGHFCLQQEIKKVRESNTRLNETIDDKSRIQSTLEEKLRSLESKESEWEKNKTDMCGKVEQLNSECTSLKDANEDLRTQIFNLNKEIDSLSASTETKKSEWERCKTEMEAKIELLNNECKSLKDINEVLRSDISKHKNQMHPLSTTAEVEDTPLAPNRIFDHQEEGKPLSIQTPDAITSIDNVHSANDAITSGKDGMSTVSSHLFKGQVCSVDQQNRVSEKTPDQTVLLSGQSMAERLKRLKLANEKASIRLKYVSSIASAARIRNMNVTPLIVKPAVCLEKANNSHNERSHPCENVNSTSLSVQETEAFVMNILNSCENLDSCKNSAL